MTPRPFAVVGRRREAPGVWTLELEPVDGEPLTPAPGQFTMVYAFGVGEVRAVGVRRERRPADPHRRRGRRRHDGDLRRRARAACSACADRSETAGRSTRRGARTWSWSPAESAWRRCGGAVRHLLAHRGEYGELVLLYGSRTPASLLYRREFERWRRAGMTVDVSVDAAGADWPGRVGFVTELIAPARFDPDATVAMVCGPEIMMTHCARGLLDRGVAAERPVRLARAQHALRHRLLRPLPARPDDRLPGRAGVRLRRVAPVLHVREL